MRDQIVRRPILDLLSEVLVPFPGQEAQHLSVNSVEILSVHPRVIQTLGRDLRELAGSDPAAGNKRVDGGDGALTVRASGGLAVDRLAVVVKEGVIAVPRVGLDGKGVGGVGCALMVSLDLLVHKRGEGQSARPLCDLFQCLSPQMSPSCLHSYSYYYCTKQERSGWENSRKKLTTYKLDITELVAPGSPRILPLPHMRHVAPIIRSVQLVRGLGRVEDEPISTLPVHRLRQVVDVAARRGVPADIHIRTGGRLHELEDAKDEACGCGTREGRHDGDEDEEKCEEGEDEKEVVRSLKGGHVWRVGRALISI